MCYNSITWKMVFRLGNICHVYFHRSSVCGHNWTNVFYQRRSESSLSPANGSPIGIRVYVNFCTCGYWNIETHNLSSFDVFDSFPRKSRRISLLYFRISFLSFPMNIKSTLWEDLFALNFFLWKIFSSFLKHEEIITMVQ